MLLVGLTGGIASGKSTVGRMFAARGVPVIDADRITRVLQEPGTPSYAAIVDAFGPDIVEPSGRLDRARLADRVFSSPEARRRLEGIMHPVIWSRIQSQAAEAEAAGRRVCLVEAAVLFEAGWADRFHAVIVVTAPDAAQRARLGARGVDAAGVERRLAAQWAAPAKAARAHFVIDAGGTLAETEAQVAQVHAALLAQAPGQPSPGQRTPPANNG